MFEHGPLVLPTGAAKIAQETTAHHHHLCRCILSMHDGKECETYMVWQNHFTLNSTLPKYRFQSFRVASCWFYWINEPTMTAFDCSQLSFCAKWRWKYAQFNSFISAAKIFEIHMFQNNETSNCVSNSNYFLLFHNLIQKYKINLKVYPASKILKWSSKHLQLYRAQFLNLSLSI